MVIPVVQHDRRTKATAAWPDLPPAVPDATSHPLASSNAERLRFRDVSASAGTSSADEAAWLNEGRRSGNRVHRSELGNQTPARSPRAARAVERHRLGCGFHDSACGIRSSTRRVARFLFELCKQSIDDRHPLVRSGFSGFADARGRAHPTPYATHAHRGMVPRPCVNLMSVPLWCLGRDTSSSMSRRT